MVKLTKKELLSMLVLLPMFFIIGCADDGDGGGGGTGPSDPPIEDNTIVTVVEADPGDTPDATLVPNSKAINTLGLSNPLVITFTEGKAETTGGTNASATVNGSNVAVTLGGNSANIVIQGISSTGSVRIAGDFDCNVYLNGVGITATNSAAVINDGKGAMNVNIVEGTANRLIDNATSNDKSALYSEGDLNIAGNGTLEVRGNVSHAIASDGSFKQTAGNVWAKSALKDGVNAKSITISGGSFKARVIGDGLQGDDFITVTGGDLNIITLAEDQKVNGLKSDGNIEISGSPKIKAIVYGTASKSISSDGNLTISGGNFLLQTAGNGFWDESEEAADKTSACAGIKCDGDLHITNGTFSILSSGTGGKGISVDGDITIDGGKFKIATTGEPYTHGYFAANPVAIKGYNDIMINGGNFYVKTFGADGEGIEGEYNITINDGYLEIESFDDGFNAAGGPDETKGKITINGGKIYCNSKNDDGIDCNGSITITGGIVIAYGNYSWAEGFDCDSYDFTVTGGILLGVALKTSLLTAPSTSSAVVINATRSDIYYIESASGEEVGTFELLPQPESYNGRIGILFSSPKLVSGNQYTLYSGGKISGGTKFHGLYTNAEYTKGNLIKTFTATGNDSLQAPSIGKSN